MSIIESLKNVIHIRPEYEFLLHSFGFGIGAALEILGGGGVDLSNSYRQFASHGGILKERMNKNAISALHVLEEKHFTSL